mmetsp:Transcript_14023/g.10111  ORF Transcript_14023/g.10111 Transcript_14023/m.10111 type:complete len:85 (-) Transcript_14023:285-539(-)
MMGSSDNMFSSQIDPQKLKNTFSESDLFAGVTLQQPLDRFEAPPMDAGMFDFDAPAFNQLTELIEQPLPPMDPEKQEPSFHAGQ